MADLETNNEGNPPPVDLLTAQLQVLKFEPGDRLIVSVPGFLSMVARARLEEAFLDRGLGPVIVLEKGMQIGVLRGLEHNGTSGTKANADGDLGNTRQPPRQIPQA